MPTTQVVQEKYELLLSHCFTRGFACLLLDDIDSERNNTRITMKVTDIVRKKISWYLKERK